MSSEHVLGKEASAASDEQTSEEWAVPNRPELRATVELESQAKVDTNHPDATPEGMTLAGEEKFAAREAEIRATRQRADDRQQSSREARSRRVASQGSEQRRRTFQKRAASVVPSQGPDDPRELLERDVVAEINQHADRLVTQLQGWSRAAIARRLASRVLNGANVQSAVLTVIERCQRAPGTVVPIAALSEIDRAEVSIQGRVVQPWESDHPKIHQVGLVEDDTGRTKFTSWKKSRARTVSEGDWVVFRGVAKSWYQGRCSVAVTGTSSVLVRR